LRWMPCSNKAFRDAFHRDMYLATAPSRRLLPALLSPITAPRRAARPTRLP
jgi:hypothetical protein